MKNGAMHQEIKTAVHSPTESGRTNRKAAVNSRMPNAALRRTIEEVRRGENLTSYPDAKSAFRALADS